MGLRIKKDRGKLKSPIKTHTNTVRLFLIDGNAANGKRFDLRIPVLLKSLKIPIPGIETE